jgi:hypothetical protein
MQDVAVKDRHLLSIAIYISHIACVSTINKQRTQTWGSEKESGNKSNN